MAAEMYVDIVSAEESIFSGQASYLLARSTEGEVGIMPKHIAMLAKLQPGEVMVRDNEGNEQFFYVSGGMLEVQPDVVTVLGDTAVRAHDLDEAAAEDARRRAEEAANEQSADLDYARAQAELIEAAARVRTIKNLRNRHGAIR